ncbi:outer membrane beta-barrel protein [Mesonia maritima]|uniref:outer membrane beta-barrel protein n=1 Tax=Mesonia maritima TaxID=1793873 RepID=UPI00362D0A43
MKCRFILILLFLAISTSGFAQKNIHFGIKAGGNLSGFHTGKSINTGNSGINFGGVAELELNDLFSLQSEIIYNRKGGLIDVKDKSFSEFILSKQILIILIFRFKLKYIF